MGTDCITYAVAEGLGIKQPTWSQTVCFCMHTGCVSEEQRPLYAAYELGLLSFGFPDLFLIVQMTEGFTGMRMSIMCLDLIIMEVNTPTTTLGWGSEEGLLFAAFQRTSVPSGFSLSFHSCSAVSTSTLKSPWICPCWAPALLNKLDPYTFGKQDNVQWKGIFIPCTMSGLCSIITVISCCLVLLVVDHLKLLWVWCWRGWKSFQFIFFFPLKSGSLVFTGRDCPAERGGSLREGAAWTSCLAACCSKPPAQKAIAAFWTQWSKSMA